MRLRSCVVVLIVLIFCRLDYVSVVFRLCLCLNALCYVVSCIVLVIGFRGC